MESSHHKMTADTGNKFYRYLPGVVLAAIIFLYSVIALRDLGYSYAPSTSWQAQGKGSRIELDFGKDIFIGGFRYYLGNYEHREFSLEIGSGEPVQWESLGTVRFDRVYQWSSTSVNRSGRYLRLTSEKQFSELKELIVYDRSGENLIPENAASYQELFDEAYMYPGYITFRSGTIFDELFFGRTAYEYLHGLQSYEDTHPPLGKILISIGIAVFGMNPWGWRVMGTLSGILMLPLAWVFARRVLKSSWMACGVAALLAFDFMHFTQTRLAGVDGFLVLFIWTSYYFVFRYWEEIRDGAGRGWRFLPPAGFFLGMAVSCKWSGFYAGAGMALILFAIFIAGLRKGTLSGKYLRQTFWVCAGSFFIIPAAVYVASYFPYIPPGGKNGLWQDMWMNQKNMLAYHVNVSSSHQYASPWYQWPLMIHPFPFFRNYRGDMAEAVFAIGNPVVWWSGAASFFLCLYKVMDKRDKTAAFLCTIYLAPLLPWIFVHRSSFLYHYFPCVFPSILCTAYCCKVGKKGKFCMGGLVLGAGVAFLMFYPILAGQMVKIRYIETWLNWLPGWGLAD